jgi:hypothetical protein
MNEWKPAARLAANIRGKALLFKSSHDCGTVSSNRCIWQGMKFLAASYVFV